MTLARLSVVFAALAFLGTFGWILVIVFERFGGLGGFVLSSVAATALVVWVTPRLLSQGRERLAALSAVTAILLVPLALYGLELGLGILAEGPPPETLGQLVTSHDFLPVAAAIVAAVIVLQRFKLPVLVVVVIFTVWLGVQVGASLVFGDGVSWGQRVFASVAVGLMGIGAGFVVDGRTNVDYASPLYLAGLLGVIGGMLTYHASVGIDAQLEMIVLELIVFVWLLLVALALRRRIFALFGAIILSGLLGDLTERLLTEVEPFAIASIALGVIGAALVYERIELAWSRAVVARLPELVRRALPPRARS